MSFQKACVFYTLLLAFVVLATNQLVAQTSKSELITIRAQLVGKFHQTSIPYARIINKTQMWGVLSDTAGTFTIAARYNDTIYISSLGYFSQQLFVKDTLLKQVRIPTIWMTEKVYEMAEIDIQSLGTYQQFKYKVLHLKMPQSTIKDAIASIQKELNMIPRHQLQHEMSIPLGSPISMLYNMFSKEGKSLRKLAEAQEKHEVFKMVNPKFNRKVVQSITGFQGNLLDQFMMFCTPPDFFIINATEYEIHQRIMFDYEAFITILKNRRN